MQEREKEFRQIVFFDGDCHLCNGFVDFAIQNGTAEKSLFFAPLQGSTAAALINEKDREELQTVLFWDGKNLHREAQAILKVFSALRQPLPFFSILSKAIPQTLQNKLYRSIAKNRYLWFGKREFCRMPLPNETSQLLP